MPDSLVTALLADPIANYPSATVALFDATCAELPRRKLDGVRNRRYIEQLTALGVPGILIGASTGHGHLRTPSELDEWMAASAEADWRTTVKMVLLRPEDPAPAQTQLVRRAAECGYAVVFVRPGTNLPRDASDAAVVDNMRPLVELAAEQGLAVGLYSIPDVSGVRLTPAAAAQLNAGPGGRATVAIKVTEADYVTSTLEFLKSAELRRLKIVQGWDPHLARALRDGPQWDPHQRQRCGVTSGPMSFAVFQYLHLLERAQAGDWDEVELAQQAVTSLFASMQDDPHKFADLQRAKYVMGLGQPLLSAISPPQINRLLAALEELPRADDRQRLARSLNLLGDGPYASQLGAWESAPRASASRESQP